MLSDFSFFLPFRLSMIMVFFGLGFLILIFVLQIPSIDYQDTAKALKVVFYVLPNYAVAQVCHVL